MCSSSKARPPSALPILADRETFQLESRIDWYHAVDLAIRVLMILAGVFLLGIKVDTGQRHIEVVGAGHLDLHGD